MDLPARHSRGGGNPGLSSLQLVWIPAPAFARACFRIAGMTIGDIPVYSFYYPQLYFQKEDMKARRFVVRIHRSSAETLR